VRLGRDATAILTNADGEATGVRHVARKGGEDAQEIAARVVMANCAPSVAAALLPARARADGAGVWRAALSTRCFAPILAESKARQHWPRRLQRDSAAGDDDALSQYGDGAAAMGADPPRVAALLHRQFTAVDSGLGRAADARPCSGSRLSNWSTSRAMRSSRDANAG